MSFYSRAYYTSNGSQTDYTVSFPYLNKSHVGVLLNGVSSSAWTWVNDTTIRLNSAPAAGTVVLVRRSTSPQSRIVDFVAPSSLNEDDLDNDSLQGFYLSQEAFDASSATVSDDVVTGQFTAGGKRLTNVGDPVDAQDATTKHYVDGFMSTSVSQAAASATAAANSATAAAASASGALTSKNAADADATAAHADRVQADADAAATAADRTAAANSASVASTSATNSANSATASANSATASETSRQASVTAKTASETARDASVSAKTAAEAARDTSVTKAGEAASSASDAAASAAAAAASASSTQPVATQVTAAPTTAPVDTGWVPWVTAAGALAKVTWANAWAYFKGKADTLYATAAQGTKADAAMPKTGGTFTGAINVTIPASAVPVSIKSDSASYRAWLLFYQGAANQAQIGVLEDTNLHIGVNDDSAVYREAMNVQRTTGNVTFPQAMFVTGSAQVGQGLNALGGVYDVSQRVYSPNNPQMSGAGTKVGDLVYAQTTTAVAYGATVAGSALKPVNGANNPTASALAGTWDCLGQASAVNNTLFQKVLN